MPEDFSFALRRAALLFLAIAAPLAVAGVIWARVDHHAVGFTVPALLYIAAALVGAGGTFAKSSSRKEYKKLTIKQRREAFSTQMWLFAIAVALGVTAFVLQQIL